MPEEKKYINGIIIKEKVFDNGGKQLKVSIAISELIKQLSDIKDKSDSDWANLIIARRREPSDKGVTHYVYQDTWQPDSEYKPNKFDQHKSKYGSEESKNDKDELPF
jgi:hypothetical protein